MVSLRTWLKTAVGLATVALAMAVAQTALALSPAGTPEYKAEMVAIQKMGQNYGGYRVMTNSVQMRGNRRSISIPTYNGAGKQVNFMSYVRRVDERTGGYHYEVDEPKFDN